jgi:hypothetical protein
LGCGSAGSVCRGAVPNVAVLGQIVRASHIDGAVHVRGVRNKSRSLAMSSRLVGRPQLVAPW